MQVRIIVYLPVRIDFGGVWLSRTTHTINTPRTCLIFLDPKLNSPGVVSKRSVRKITLLCDHFLESPYFERSGDRDRIRSAMTCLIFLFLFSQWLIDRVETGKARASLVCQRGP